MSKSLHLSGTVFHLQSGAGDSPALPTSHAARDKLLKGALLACKIAPRPHPCTALTPCAEDPCVPRAGSRLCSPAHTFSPAFPELPQALAPASPKALERTVTICVCVGLSYWTAAPRRPGADRSLHTRSTQPWAGHRAACDLWLAEPMDEGASLAVSPLPGNPRQSPHCSLVDVSDSEVLKEFSKSPFFSSF